MYNMGVKPMATRIPLGGEYTSQNGEQRNKFWIDVSASTLNELQGVVMSPQNDYDDIRDVLAAILQGDENIDELVGWEGADYSQEE